MTKQMQIILAVKALVAAALPLAEVRGFEGDASIPEVTPEDGIVFGFPGDPGEPDVDLSPLAYNYEHSIPLEVSAPGPGAPAKVDAMLVAIGTAILANRFLGGLCCWLEATSPVREDRTSEDVTINWAEISIVAHYSTADPLG